jgi:hypothetical protein
MRIWVTKAWRSAGLILCICCCCCWVVSTMVGVLYLKSRCF